MSAQLFSGLFEDLTKWQVFASGLAEGKLSQIQAPDGSNGIRLDYDFREGGGFVAIRRAIDVTLPSTFEVGFLVCGESPGNHFEFKVASPGGLNVWRHLCSDFIPPATWSQHRFHERDLPFAWGPAGGGSPSDIEAVEFVVAAGPGGKGNIQLASPSLDDQTLQSAAAIHSSSQQAGCSPELVFAAQSSAEWRAAVDDQKPWWQVDFGRILRFGGLVIDWPEGLPPRAFSIDLSDDNQTWKTIHHAKAASGPRSYIAVPHGDARHLRVTFEDAKYAALSGITLQPDAFTHTPNQFIHSVAADFPRGWFPRYWLREQSYWTPVGHPDGKRRALINEEGMIETDEAGFSLEPFIRNQNGTLTWADVKTAVSLPKGGAPMPSVTWKSAGLRLEIHPWVDGKGEHLTLHTTYRLECSKPAPGTQLIIAIRPYQVNPPWQAFRNLGGRSPIHHITCRGDGMSVEGREVTTSPQPDARGAAAFEEGCVPSILTHGRVPLSQHIDDRSGLASAEMAWSLPAGEKILEVTVSVPFFKNTPAPSGSARANALARWRRKLGSVKWQVPASAAPAFDCFRTAAAHILINRDGPAIQPGPRRYTRSWVRDCVIMGAALAKAGLPEALREFLTWYAPFQREDGFIPCVVDRDGIDWLVEHDSHGQFLWGVREVFRNGGDKKFLKRMLPHVIKAADYIVTLRASRMTEHYQSGDPATCFGLLPESASHEGYLAHPVHSYWDDFWGVRGLDAAGDLAAAMGLLAEAKRWKSETAEFQADLIRSIEKVIVSKQLNYIPGSVEWADFDPTATANAIGMLDFADSLPSTSLHSTLETYLEGFRRRQRAEIMWNNYTAYEIRIIGAFVRLGNREVANELLSFFLSDRQPQEWNQWPEITWRDPRSPGHLGDVPHTWIAAEYLLAVASMVAAERDASASMILASGMPWTWISEAEGFSVQNLPTRYGALDFLIRAESANMIRAEISASISLPPGGLTLAPPLPLGARIVSVADHQGSHAPLDEEGTSVVITSLPWAADLHLGVKSALV